jgi:hypothetical protein
MRLMLAGFKSVRHHRAHKLMRHCEIQVFTLGSTGHYWGYDHVIINQSASRHPPHVLLPGVHLVASLLKRWLLGTYQGGVSREHLNYYLDEFTFRFNRRSSRSRGLLFYRLLEQAVQTAHTSTGALAMGTRRGPRRKNPPTISCGRWQEADT